MTPADVLLEAPRSLWGALAAAVHRVAHNRVHRSTLPVQLRPFAAFRPANLLTGAPRAAIAEAVSSDARLREQIGEELPNSAWAAAAESSPDELSARFGAEVAFAALAARARWDDVATLVEAAPPEPQPDVASASSAQSPASATASRSSGDAAQRQAADAAKRATDQRRRADAAEGRARVLESDVALLRQEVEHIRAELSGVTAKLDEERSKSRDRLARMRRRVDEAQARARVDAARVLDVAETLESLATDLREALAGATDGPAAEGSGKPDDGNRTVPRTVPAAAGGRPAQLPAGLHPDDPLAVEALLQVPGIAVVVDGYNVSKDVRGKPAAELGDQRRWLEALLAGVGARFGATAVVVWDGEADRTTTTSTRRGLKAVFTEHTETADERIVAIVDELGGTVMVVTSDREVRDHCEALGANVVGSGVFLRAVA